MVAETSLFGCSPLRSLDSSVLVLRPQGVQQVVNFPEKKQLFSPVTSVFLRYSASALMCHATTCIEFSESRSNIPIINSQGLPQMFVSPCTIL